MSTIQTIPTSSNSPNKREEDIHLILSLLQKRVDELKEDVSVSKQLLFNGVNTELSTQIEKTIDNPFLSLTNVKKDLDEKTKTLINALLKSLFGNNKDVIQEVYKSKISENINDILYCILLREDNYANRKKVFAILDWYENMEFSSFFPVDFQFVPAELSGNLEYTDKFTF